MHAKEIAVVIQKGLLAEDRQYILVGRKGNFITFRKVADEPPFYYGLIKEVSRPEWFERMQEKRWFTKEVEGAVKQLI